MIDSTSDPRGSLPTTGEGRRSLYRKPELRLHGTLEPKLLGSPPPPPTGGMILGIRKFPWK